MHTVNFARLGPSQASICLSILPSVAALTPIIGIHVRHSSTPAEQPRPPLRQTSRISQVPISQRPAWVMRVWCASNAYDDFALGFAS
ncbi:hypothetical protein B0H63DRAFT_1840 [Podospora didyma]|uniref:Uncharacterized protein n=1 Tax=Podospora didyma TaxID=330526 RepID=A0AAE0P402_9PEZI|nr:hypothetical protein B0H63DRAFT_1840 [Podospora didyma]